MIRFLYAAVAMQFVFLVSQAQFYETGENPASESWNFIKSENFKIIYPARLMQDAQMLAARMESALDSAGDMARPLKRQFPVLLQNGSVLSNGFVALAPRRMELQITPPQDSYSQDWLSQLTLHEFRHIAQLNMLDQGFTTVIGWFTGEISHGLISAQVPAWFYEGDAVHNETRLSNSGRGRSAAFEMPLRTLIMNGDKTFSFDKAMFGSYRDFVPDRYIYGYKLTGYLRSHFGSRSWSQALEFVSRNPYQIWPFSFYLKKNYGFYKSGLYKVTVDSLKEQYQGLQNNKTAGEYLIINKPRKVYTSYHHPLKWKQSIIAYAYGLDDPGSFVLIDSMGREKRILQTGMTVPGGTDVFNSKLVWDEVKTDPRWKKRDYSVIKERDLVTGKTRLLTRKSRYFSPDFSPDGTRIAVSENDIFNQNFLTIIDSHSGKVINRLPFGYTSVITPVWSGINEVIVITVSSEGKQLESCDLNTGVRKTIVSYTSNNISDPVNYGHYIIFRADSGMVENLFAVSKSSGKINRVTDSKFGARYPEADSSRQTLTFSEYSPNGFNIASMDLDTLNWIPVKSIIPENGGKYNPPESPDEVAFDPKPYRKAFHLFRFHSWLPFYADYEDIVSNPAEVNIYPGFILFSQNMLGTSVSSIGYNYRNGFHYLTPTFTWRGWYPVIEFSADAGGPRRSLSLPDEVRLHEKGGMPVKFNIRTWLPLSFSNGTYTTILRPEVEYDFLPVWYVLKDEIRQGISLFNLRFTAARYKSMSFRDLYPVWGQSLVTTFSADPAQRHYGKLYSMHVNLFFPGLLKHHHFFLQAGHQEQQFGRFILPFARVNFPRGYQESISESFSSVLINYAFPFWYPDRSLGPLMYLKRVRATIFYDIGYGKHIRSSSPGPSTGNLESFGTEITADLHVFRIIFPLSAGIRIGYMSSVDELFTEFLFRLNTSL